MNKQKYNFLSLSLILVVAFLLRLPLLNQPLLGNFESYQIVLASISRFILKEGLSGILYPKFHILFQGSPSLHMLNFPVISVLTAMLVKISGGSIHGSGYLIATLFSLASSVLLFLIARQYFDDSIALLSCLFFTFSPLSLVFGSRFFNEPIALFFMLSSFYFLSVPSQGPHLLLCASLAGLTFSLAGVSRFHFYVFLPILGLAIFNRPRNENRLLAMLIFFTVSIAPVLAWSLHSQQAATSEAHLRPVHTVTGQLFGDRFFSQTHLGNPLFYKRIIEGVVKEWFTPVFFPFLILGFFSRWERRHLIFPLWVLVTFLLGVVIPEKFYDHWFYTYPFLPAGAIIVAISFHRFVLNHPLFHKENYRGLSLFLLATTSLIAVAQVYVPAALSHPKNAPQLFEVATFVKSHTAADARIVVLGRGQSSVLYYADRLGWILEVGKETYLKEVLSGQTGAFLTKRYRRDIEDYLKIDNRGRLQRFIEEGATHLVAVDKSEIALDFAFLDFVQKKLELISDSRAPFAVYRIPRTH